MTKEQYEALKPYESHLGTALNCDYARNLTMTGLTIMENIYQEIFKRNGGLLNGCTRCRLRGLKDLARVYFDYVKEQEKKAAMVGEEPEPVAETAENQEVTKPKKKTATNKKKTE